MIESAGGAIWRVTTKLRLEVLLVHRPQKNDWSLPKGRRRSGESALSCALREVREETGFDCAVSYELPSGAYLDRRGRDRMVRYWAMRPVGGEFRPNGEVDAVRWVRATRATDELTHAHEIAVVHAMTNRLARSEAGLTVV